MTPKKSKRSASKVLRDLRLRGLTPDDLKMLRSFGIPDEMIVDAGIFRVDDRAARLRGFQFAASKNLSGVVWPYKGPLGKEFNARLRRDNPDIENGKATAKYISKPSGTERGLYWPPNGFEKLAKSPDCEVVIVEAEKSALAGTAAANRAGRNYIFVATGGCTGWYDSERGVLPDLELLSDRTVHIMFDSNVASNVNVRDAELALAMHLTNIRCHVHCLRVPPEVNGPDDFLALKKDANFWQLFKQPAEPWIAMVGESYEKYTAAQPPNFVIKDFLQDGEITLIGGLSGHGKTFVLLSTIQSLLTGQKLFGHFPVEKKAERVVYLTPEISLSAFKRRAELFELGPFIKSQQLIVRTLSAYPMRELTDPTVLLTARGADVFLDTIVRFVRGDENSSTDNDQGLAAGLFRLIQSGARTVTGSAHSPKGFEKSEYMSLENLIRGTGDIGAMVSNVWGVRMLDREKTIVHVENVKPRDFQPPPPFQLQGRPFIDQGVGFQMHMKPGEAPPFSAAIELLKRRGGRPQSTEKAERMKVLIELVRQEKSHDEIIAEMKSRPDKYPPKYFPDKASKGTVIKEVSEARKLAKARY